MPTHAAPHDHEIEVGVLHAKERAARDRVGCWPEHAGQLQRRRRHRDKGQDSNHLRCYALCAAGHGRDALGIVVWDLGGNVRTKPNSPTKPN